MTLWVIAGLLGLATGVRIGWALVNKQSLVSAAMIVALGSLAVVAALNWAPLTLMIDEAVGRTNFCIGMSQVALVASAAGSCVMVTSAASTRDRATLRRIALGQYIFAAAVAVTTLITFLAAEPQPEMSPTEYLNRNLASSGLVLHWLVPLLYVMFALTLVAWAGLRHSSSSRRGRALFVYTAGIVLIVLASAFLLIRTTWGTGSMGVGTAVAMLAAAMAVVGAGSLLPAVEDWFSGRRELYLVEPLLTELERRQPDIGIGVRPRGPLAFRVAERLSLISDALFLEATAALQGHDSKSHTTLSEPEPPMVSAVEQARAVAQWVYDGRKDSAEVATFPGAEWLRQPPSYSDREWIIEIARQYRELDNS